VAAGSLSRREATNVAPTHGRAALAREPLTRAKRDGRVGQHVKPEVPMPKFMIEASYTLDGVKGVQSAGGTSRRDAVAQVAESVGGKLESFYFAFGEHDAYVTVELPDNESAAAVALSVNAAGGATVKTVVLLTPDELDAAAKRSVDYRPPGS
jgi:uncharacterized protein with GYD domain